MGGVVTPVWRRWSSFSCALHSLWLRRRLRPQQCSRSIHERLLSQFESKQFDLIGNCHSDAGRFQNSNADTRHSLDQQCSRYRMRLCPSFRLHILHCSHPLDQIHTSADGKHCDKDGGNLVHPSCSTQTAHRTPSLKFLEKSKSKLSKTRI